MAQHLLRAILLALFAFLATDATARAEAPLPSELSLPMEQAQTLFRDGKYAEAIRLLTEYAGPDHPVRLLLLGHAHARLEHWDEATKAYQEALLKDETYRAAGIALAQAYARQQKWLDVLQLAGRFINPEKDKADEVLFYTQAAYFARDLRLAGRVARRALERFPLDERIRRMDILLLVEEKQWPAVAQTALALLKQHPGDAELWGQYFQAAQTVQPGTEACAAAEAAMLCKPQDLLLRRIWLTAQMMAGHRELVLHEGDALLSGKQKEDVLKEQDFLLLFLRTADLAGDDERLWRWAELLEPKQRSRDVLICLARSAIRQKDRPKAQQALMQLIENGAAGAADYLWAANLAEEADDLASAEAHYRQAQSMSGEGTQRQAALHLARLLWLMQRQDEARNLLEEYLRRYPEDAAARSMGLVFKK